MKKVVQINRVTTRQEDAVIELPVCTEADYGEDDTFHVIYRLHLEDGMTCHIKEWRYRDHVEFECTRKPTDYDSLVTGTQGRVVDRALFEVARKRAIEFIQKD